MQITHRWSWTLQQIRREAVQLQQDLARRNGLFTSDQTLFEDSLTQKLVEALISERLFDSEFGETMRALGTVRVKNRINRMPSSG